MVEGQKAVEALARCLIDRLHSTFTSPVCHLAVCYKQESRLMGVVFVVAWNM